MRPRVLLMVTMAVSDVERSRTLVEEALALADAPWAKLEVHTAALEFSALSGDWAYATRLGDEILRMARASGARYHVAGICQAMGAHLRATGRHDEAEALLLEAQDLFRDMDCPWQLGRTQRELALLRRAQGREREASDLLREALGRFEALGAAPDIERTRALLSAVST